MENTAEIDHEGANPLDSTKSDIINVSRMKCLFCEKKRKIANHCLQLVLRTNSKEIFQRIHSTATDLDDVKMLTKLARLSDDGMENTLE